MSGEELRKARDARDLSREKVAAQLNPPVSAKTLERWESGARVKRWRLEQLAAIYGIELTAVAA